MHETSPKPSNELELFAGLEPATQELAVELFESLDRERLLPELHGSVARTIAQLYDDRPELAPISFDAAVELAESGEIGSLGFSPEDEHTIDAYAEASSFSGFGDLSFEDVSRALGIETELGTMAAMIRVTARLNDLSEDDLVTLRALQDYQEPDKQDVRESGVIAELSGELELDEFSDPTTDNEPVIEEDPFATHLHSVLRAGSMKAIDAIEQALTRHNATSIHVLSLARIFGRPFEKETDIVLLAMDLQEDLDELIKEDIAHFALQESTQITLYEQIAFALDLLPDAEADEDQEGEETDTLELNGEIFEI